MLNTVGVVIPLLVYAVGAYVLFWVIRLGVRYGLRDHARWTPPDRPHQ